MDLHHPARARSALPACSPGCSFRGPSGSTGTVSRSACADEPRIIRPARALIGSGGGGPSTGTLPRSRPGRPGSGGLERTGSAGHGVGEREPPGVEGVARRAAARARSAVGQLTLGEAIEDALVRAVDLVADDLAGRRSGGGRGSGAGGRCAGGRRRSATGAPSGAGAAPAPRSRSPTARPAGSTCMRTRTVEAPVSASGGVDREARPRAARPGRARGRSSAPARLAKSRFRTLVTSGRDAAERAGPRSRGRCGGPGRPCDRGSGPAPAR